MVSDSTDIGTIFLEIIKCGANLVSEFFMIFSKIFELNYLQRIPAANSLFFTVLSHICALDTRNVSRVVTTVSRQQSRGLYRTGEG